MVCAKCEAKEKATKKSTGLAVTDVWKPSGSGSDQRNERKIGGNKLLEAKRRYAAPVPVAGTALRKGAASTSSIGPVRRGGAAARDQPFGQCKLCKVTVAKEGAMYCQKCAYPKSLCIMCGVKMMDTSSYKMSAK